MKLNEEMNLRKSQANVKFYRLCETLHQDWSSLAGTDGRPLVLRVHTLILSQLDRRAKLWVQTLV